MKREKVVISIWICIVSVVMPFLFITLCGGMSEERWIRI